MNGTEAVNKLCKSPQADRDPDLPVPDRRQAALRQTRMYQDTQRILSTATEVKQAIEAFIDSHDPENQVSCDMIAPHLFSDAKGFLWALNMFVGRVGSLLDLRTEVA